MSCRITAEVCKTEVEAKAWGFDYVRDAETGTLGFLARAWRPGQIYAGGTVVLPNVQRAGLQFVSEGSGQSGAKEPSWPSVVGGTIKDGSIQWTAQALSNDSLLTTITASTWEADEPLTLSGQSLINTGGVQRTTVVVSGGTVRAEPYEVRNLVTLANGAIEQSILNVQVE